MKILEYEFSGGGWKMDKLAFQDVNLIVGDSGSGKTRLFNTMFNLGTHVAQKSVGGESQWKIKIESQGNFYLWDVSVGPDIKGDRVLHESVFKNDAKLVERSPDNFSFLGNPLPQLASNEMSISILRETPEIRPLYDGFSRILRRRFFSDDLEKASGIMSINLNVLDKIGETRDLFEVYKADLWLNPRLSILSSHFPEIYNKIINAYTDIFDFIVDIDVVDSDHLGLVKIPSPAPIFCIKETNVNEWIRLDELSSGMKKVLLILTDVFSLPPGTIYLIDEYENSLGVGPINFLPDILLSETLNIQLFITSHHPYIIDKFPVSTWYVTHRTGSHVSFDSGPMLEERFGSSKQAKFIQLLNDPRYSEGIQ